MPAHSPRASIALRLSVWYALSAALLILTAVGALYWVLASNMEREDERTELDEIANLRVVLGEAPSAGAGLVPATERPNRQVYVRLLSPAGAVVRETPGMRAIAPPPPPGALRGLPPEGKETERATPDGRVLETRTAPLAADGSARDGFAQVSMDRTQDETVLAAYQRSMILVLGLALIATVTAGYLMACAAMRPIRRIGAVAAEVGSGNLHERIGRAALPVELWLLAGAFNTMLDRLENAFARTARFSDDVAHELRTPINNMRGELEVALSRARTADQYREALSSALEECERLGRIVGSLGFLARADERAELQCETVDVGRELAAVRDFYEAAATEQGTVLQLELEPGLAARLDRTLFQQAVGNLVSNAIAHTPAGGEIRVRAWRDAAGLRLEVRDTGCGIAPEHLPHVFDRFYRADAARSGGHVGLGLAVVRSIAERHGGRASIASAPGQGTRVELVLPA